MSEPLIAQWLRAGRKAGKSLDQLAAEIGVSYTTVHRAAKKYRIGAFVELRGGYRPRRPDPRGKNRLTLPKVDPDRAARITREKMRAWGMAS